MKIYKQDYQPQILDKYKIDFSDFSLSEVKVPAYDECVGTIYMFVNNINSKVYIGQTYTKFYQRFSSHFTDTFTKMDKLVFHMAIRKYGWDNFSKYILWQTSECYAKTPENKKVIKDILNQKEIEYISIYNSNDLSFGYNLTKGGEYIPGSAYSKEARTKANNTMDIKHTKPMLGKVYDKHHLAVKVLQYDLNKNFIKEWSCIKLAEDTLHISIHLKGITSGGYFWVYKNNSSNEQLEEKYNKYIKAKESGNMGTINPVYCFNLYKEQIGYYSSVAEASKITGVPAAQIDHACISQENGNIVHNYIWIFEKDFSKRHIIINTLINKSKVYKFKYRPIYQIYLNGDIIKLWDNFESIISQYPFSKASINKCLNNKLNVYQNCFWIYVDDYSDDNLYSRIENFRKTKKILVDEILSGNLPYKGITEDRPLNTADRKQYLKDHPIVYQFTKDFKLVKKWDTYKDIEKETDFKFDNISKNLRGKMKSAYGYIWKFEEGVKNININETY